MNFIMKPSLEHMARVKIASSLWHQKDIRDLILKLGSRNRYVTSAWAEIEERVIEKVPQLPLPELLKEKVANFIKPVGIQVLEFMELNFQTYDLPLHLPAEFCWTPQGTIDKKRTANLLVEDENLDICLRYKLACIYCLENDILELWKKIPVNRKESLCQEPNWDEKPANIIITQWSLNMKGKAQFNYKDEFKTSVRYGNFIAAAFFLEKLTPRQKKKSLLEAGIAMVNNDGLHFVISNMDNEQQMKLFKERAYYVLQCFLQWPLQSFFLEVASRTYDFLSADHFETILNTIDGKLDAGYKDCDYKTLFREFCQRSPTALKSLFITNIDNSLLPSWFDNEDEEKIRLIFKDTTFKDIKKFIYGNEMKDCLVSAISENHWDFLKFFIQEYFPSKDEMLKFKKRFEKRMHPMHCNFKKHFAANKQNWEHLFGLSDHSSFKIRNIEEGESSTSK